MPTYLFLIIVPLSLALLRILYTACVKPSLNRIPAVPEHLSLSGKTNFRYTLSIPLYPIQTSLPCTDRGASSYGKQSGPHTNNCRRG